MARLEVATAILSRQWERKASLRQEEESNWSYAKASRLEIRREKSQKTMLLKKELGRP